MQRFLVQNSKKISIIFFKPPGHSDSILKEFNFNNIHNNDCSFRSLQKKLIIYEKLNKKFIDLPHKNPNFICPTNNIVVKKKKKNLSTTVSKR